ncbi:MAG: hypothetical protein NZO58_05160, partial [Gemmataceae bacterium]|nr:hypothetical protein [Gemmataceae bacterium]
MERRRGIRTVHAAWLVPMLVCGCTPWWTYLVSEQRHFEIRDVTQLPRVPLPDIPPPETVTNRLPKDTPVKQLTLDEAIHIALRNSEVVRVLAGVTAVSSGRTIYDVAVTNTTIDQAKGVFDPVLGIGMRWNRTETPVGVLQPLLPVGAGIEATRVDDRTFDLNLAKKNLTGGVLNFNVTDSVASSRPGIFALNPVERSAATLSYTQPLLRGAGPAANLAPIVIARINTEISFFQFKDQVQAMVRGVIEAYWN